MTVLQLNAAIELDQVLKGIEQLDTPELEHFFSQVGILLARRQDPGIPQRQAELLQKINMPLPADTLAEYQELSQKQQDDSITPNEHTHLLDLVDVVEQADAERMHHLLELAQLLKLPLGTLMKQLGMQVPATSTTGNQ